MAARPFTFVATKVTKKACQQKCFFSLLAFSLQNQPKPRAAILCPISFALANTSQSLLMPFPALCAIIVLTDFNRSYSAGVKSLTQPA
jgi:hypothetical protein